MCSPFNTSFSDDTFLEQLPFCFSKRVRVSGSFKFGLFSNLSCLSNWLYDPFSSKILMRLFLLENRAQNVNDLHLVLGQRTVNCLVKTFYLLNCLKLELGT